MHVVKCLLLIVFLMGAVNSIHFIFYLQLEILTNLATETNIATILREFQVKLHVPFMYY